MLSAEELSWMRDCVEDTLPDTLSVYTKTSTRTNGVVIDSWADSGTTYACRLDSKQYQRTENSGAVKFYHRYILTVPYDASIVITDHVVHNNIEYSIVSIDLDKSWPACRRLNVERWHD